MESMYSSRFWELVESPSRIKLIECKWIYKRKKWVDGKVENLQGKVVVKQYTQKEIINYKENFSLVAMLMSIRILLSITTYFDYEIWQMDVKMTF